MTIHPSRQSNPSYHLMPVVKKRKVSTSEAIEYPDDTPSFAPAFRGQCTVEEFIAFMEEFANMRQSSPHSIDMVSCLLERCIEYGTEVLPKWKLQINKAHNVFYELRFCRFIDTQKKVSLSINIDEHCPESEEYGLTKCLFGMPMEEDLSKGEWGWFSAGHRTSGREVKTLASSISRFFGIPKVRLYDIAVAELQGYTELPGYEDNFLISIFRQILLGAEKGPYYASEGFALEEGKMIRFGSSEFPQDWNNQLQAVKILQDVKISELFSSQLKGFRTDRKQLLKYMRDIGMTRLESEKAICVFKICC